MEEEPAPTPPPQEDRGGSFGFFHFLGAFLLLLFLYVLSIGPVAKIYVGRRPTSLVVDHVYDPLAFLYRRSSICRSFFDWYLGDVWKMGRPPSATPSTPVQATQTTNSTK